jgi:CheY-like chemotaxis protein
MAAGFDGYQSKPINVKDFVQAVQQMLERHRGAGGQA